MGLGSILKDGAEGFFLAPHIIEGADRSNEFIRDEVLGGKEAKEAADARVQGARNAADLFREFSGRLREQAAPLREFRNQNLTGLLDLIRGGTGFEQSPEYRGVLAAAMRPTANAGSFSGALADRARGLASMMFDPFASRVATQAGVGARGLNSTNAMLQESANAQAGLLSQAGLESGQGIMAQNQAARQTATGIGTLLAGIFCDERLKKNIKKVGQLENGVNIYEWEWIDGRDLPAVGPIAQEVRETHPDAVYEDEDGMLRVNLFTLTGVSEDDLVRSLDG